jgi:hypothetical protein
MSTHKGIRVKKLVKTRSGSTEHREVKASSEAIVEIRKRASPPSIRGYLRSSAAICVKIVSTRMAANTREFPQMFVARVGATQRSSTERSVFKQST